MKALSIKQPWAWLICAGYKDIENRNWRIGRNQRHGPFSNRDVDDFTIELPQRIYVHTGKAIDYEALGELVRQGRMPPFKTHDIQTGAIIGEVDITGCVEESASPWFEGPYGFTLANPVLYKVPIPCRGKLGFFEPEIDLLKGINDQSLHPDQP